MYVCALCGIYVHGYVYIGSRLTLCLMRVALARVRALALSTPPHTHTTITPLFLFLDAVCHQQKKTMASSCACRYLNVWVFLSVYLHRSASMRAYMHR